jgi:DNA-binding NtrC family response regulator
MARGAGDLKAIMRRIETRLLLRALDAAGWSYGKAAAQLGIHRNTLRYRLQALGIRRPAGPGLTNDSSENR